MTCNPACNSTSTSRVVTINAMPLPLPPRPVWQVYEASGALNPEGAGHLIDVNGWRALHAIDDDMADV